MIITFPTYYEKFKCIADKCTDTCCVGWQIVVDSKTAEFYNSLNSSFGEKIREKMTVDEDGDTVFINENGRCPFLNDSNLCDIYINAGEENLCHTCTMFPRFYETFGGTREMGLSLSCPVANNLILNDKELTFTQDFTDEDPEFNDLDADRYLCLKGEREKLINFAKSDLSMSDKLSAILDYAEDLRVLLEEENYDEISKLKLKDNSITELKKSESIFEKLEYLTGKGRNILTENKVYSSVFSPEYTNILVYFIYRYFLKSIYKGNTYECLKFAVFSIKTISALENNGHSLADSSRIYSKEIEHSQYNLDSVLEYLN